MRTRFLAVLLIESALALGAMAQERQASLAADPAALNIFWQLLQKANYGYSRLEQAAFIVRTQQGALWCVLWPRPDEEDIRRWYGPYPPGTIAIAPTHPNWSPHPSRIDLRAVSKTGIPVFVITRTKIVVTEDGAEESLRNGDWKPAAAVPLCRNAT